jgi:hypothetical protein
METVSSEPREAMSTPTPERITKLPFWAQSYIKDLCRQLEEAISERKKAITDLDEWCDKQTKSQYSIPELPFTGMPLLDYFAVHAPENEVESIMELEDGNGRAVCETVYSARYRWADEMLSERAKERKP